MDLLTFGDESGNWIILYINLSMSCVMGLLFFILLSVPSLRRGDFAEMLPVLPKVVGALVGLLAGGCFLWLLGYGNWSVFYTASILNDDAFSVTYQVPEDTIVVRCSEVKSIKIVKGSVTQHRTKTRGWRLVIQTREQTLRSGLMLNDKEAVQRLKAFCPTHAIEKVPSTPTN